MRLAVFSDVHGQVERLSACLHSIARVGADELWCLGDTVDAFAVGQPELISACVNAIDGVCAVKLTGKPRSVGVARRISARRRRHGAGGLDGRGTPRGGACRAREPAEPSDGVPVRRAHGRCGDRPPARLAVRARPHAPGGALDPGQGRHVAAPAPPELPEARPFRASNRLPRRDHRPTTRGIGKNRVTSRRRRSLASPSAAALVPNRCLEPELPALQSSGGGVSPAEAMRAAVVCSVSVDFRNFSG
jgi:calcineurin-like phosphoesterase family protein